MKSSIRRTIPLLLLAATIGCASYQKRTYDVTVHNETPKPITIWLVKDGPRYEKQWRTPEDIAIEKPRNTDRVQGVIIPAGKTAHSGPVEGQFATDSSAWLRVYSGEVGLDESLSLSRGSSRRADEKLYPGATEVAVRTEDGRLIVLTRQKQP